MYRRSNYGKSQPPRARFPAPGKISNARNQSKYIVTSKDGSTKNENCMGMAETEMMKVATLPEVVTAPMRLNEPLHRFSIVPGIQPGRIENSDNNRYNTVEGRSPDTEVLIGSTENITEEAGTKMQNDTDVSSEDEEIERESMKKESEPIYDEDDSSSDSETNLFSSFEGIDLEDLAEMHAAIQEYLQMKAELQEYIQVHESQKMDFFNKRIDKFLAEEMDKGELLMFLKETVQWIIAQDQYDTDSVATRVKILYNSYNKSSYKEHRKDIADMLTQEKWQATTVKMMQYFNETEAYIAYTTATTTAYYLSGMMWCYTDASLELAKSLADEGIIQILLNNAGQQSNIDNLDSRMGVYFMKSWLGMLHNIVKVPKVKHVYRDNNATKILKPLMSSDEKRIKAVSSMIMSYIVEEGEQDLLRETECIPFLLDLLQNALENDEHRCDGFSAEELASGLGHLAINSANNQEMVDGGIIPCLTKMLKSNEREQIAATQCIIDLSLAKISREKLLNDSDCMTALTELGESQEKAKESAKTALLLIKGDGRDPSSDRKHIFISYSHKHKEKIEEIADRLKADGFEVWMDVSHMTGAIFDAMYKGILESQVMIVCISEAYRTSRNCRREATYADLIEVPLIPLKMERKFEYMKSWLGFLLQDTMYIDYEKLGFKKMYAELCKKIREAASTDTKRNVGELDHVDAISLAEGDSKRVYSQQLGSDSITSSWGEEEVQQWLDESNLQCCKAAFKGFDGKVLIGMSQARKEAPEYFYSTIGNMFSNPFQFMVFLEAFSNLK